MANFTSTHTGSVIDASVTKVSSSGVTQADLTKLNAVTSSATELNLLDGVTATTAEINILDGVTSTATELNLLDGVTGGKKNRYGGLIYGTGTIVTEEDVALGICKNCLNEIGIGHQKSAQEWRDSFDIEDFFKKLKPLKPSKPKYTETTYPGIEKRYDREYQRKSKQLKQLNNYKCSACDIDLNSSLSHRRLLHCHHKDGNDRNQAKRNLQLLCVDCHAKIGNNKNPGFPGDLDLCRRIKAEQGIHG